MCGGCICMAIQVAPFKRSQHVGDDAGTLLFAIVSPRCSLHSWNLWQTTAKKRVRWLLWNWALSTVDSNGTGHFIYYSYINRTKQTWVEPIWWQMIVQGMEQLYSEKTWTWEIPPLCSALCSCMICKCIFRSMNRTFGCQNDRGRAQSTDKSLYGHRGGNKESIQPLRSHIE